MMRRTLFAIAIALAGGCSGPDVFPTSIPNSDTAAVIIIVGYTRQPEHLRVVPGTTVVVENQDAVTHSVTSAAARGTFTPGTVAGVAAFDTSVIQPQGLSAFVIGSDAVVGTTVPYFCALHPGLPSEEGDITVVAPP